MSKRVRFYVGYERTESDGYNLIPFDSISEPTQEVFGNRFFAVIGNFKTRRGQKFFTKYGKGNPHLQTVNDAEFYAKKEVSR